MYVQICIYIHLCTRVYIYTYVIVSTSFPWHTYTHTCMHTRAHAHTHTHTHTRTCTHTITQPHAHTQAWKVGGNFSGLLLSTTSTRLASVISHVTHKNGSCRTHTWVMEYIWMIFFHHCDSTASRIESRHAHEWVMSHTCMSHGIPMRVLLLYWNWHVTHM